MILLSGFSDEISSDVTKQFEVLNKLNISYFEPRGINGKNISALNDNEISSLKESMEKYNIKASSIGSPIGKVKLSDDFDEHFNLFKRVVKIAKILESRYIRIFSFYKDGEVWTEKMIKNVIERLQMMISYAKENEVILLHENEKDIYGDSKERCLHLMENLYCDNFKAVFDPANFVQCGDDTIKAFEMLKPYIEYVHIKDSLKEDNTVVPAGKGDGHIEYILKSLYKNGYSGFLSLEPHLGSFEGLAALELDDAMLDLPKSGEGTFTIAYNALNKILDNITEAK